MLAVIMVNASASADTLVFSAVEGGDGMETGSKLLTKAYKHLNIDVKIAHLPAGRGLRMSSKGETDGEVGRIKEVGLSNPSLIRVDVPVYAVTLSLYSTRKILISSLEDVNSLSVICVRGIVKVELLAEELGFKCVYARDLNQGVDMLLKERADVLIAADKSLGRLFSDLENVSLHRVYPDFATFTLYHYLHRKHQKWVQPITEVLNELQQSRRTNKTKGVAPGDGQPPGERSQ